ncbi:DUF4292 domain-containing protein [Gaetbulibacter saemankumensis]|uniref:DUF4292 domain-containing protein n=1 Tax=Gaetbulibacter saemankumensis TaxID=311208 RepID=UPI000482747E|nr:DUF4292 domain-containing protein [Gaetbulibacter saemankumensis]
MNKIKYIILTVMAIVVFNCKSTKNLSTGNANFNLSTKQLIKENTKQKPEFKTLQSKLRISFTKDGSSQTHSVSFRAEKDKAIWMSATFSVVKALITPEEVSFYNKLDNTYFKGDYSYLSNLLGTELDFDKVQNLLYGEALYSLKEGSYKASVNEEVYILEPRRQNDLFEIFYLLDPVHFKLKSQQISQPSEYRHLQIDYTSFQEVQKEKIPERIRVIAVEANDEVIIDLEFKNVMLNHNVRFPFKIPSGFKAIEL